MRNRFIWSGLLIALILICTGQHSRAIDLEKEIKIIRPSWDSAWFNAEVFRALIHELGYQVSEPETMETSVIYEALADGTKDLFFHFNPKQHHIYFNKKVTENIDKVGYLVKHQVIRGFLIDKHSADKFNIKDWSDLRRPEVRALYDYDKNGKIEIFGCNTSWACHASINRRLKEYQIEDISEQIGTGHSRLAMIARERLEQNQPFILFVWTPHWITEEFLPGQKTYWLPVPQNKETQSYITEFNTALSLEGCIEKEVCPLGFPVGDIRTVGNMQFLKAHPDIRKLLEVVKIPPPEIAESHHRMFEGEDEFQDIRRHAREWIEKNRSIVASWLEEARALQPQKIKDKLAKLPRDLKVVTKKFEPFVVIKSNHYSGFTIDLWGEIARKLNLKYELVILTSMAKLLDEIHRKTADVGLSGIGITSEREETMDFSHSFLTSGLQIMIRKEQNTLLNTVKKFAAILFSPALLKIIFGLLLNLIIAAHLIWFIERGRSPDGFPKTYLKGILESIWWAGAILSGREGWGKVLSTSIGKVMTFAGMFIGYFIFVYFTASMTSTFTIMEIQDQIHSIDDLLNKRVATVKYSVAEEYLISQNIIPLSVHEIEEAYELLESSQVDAIVYHSPVLQYHLTHKGKGLTKVVGTTFFKQDFGFALKPGSPLRKPINQALLELIEEGSYQKIYRKWFGNRGKHE